MSHRIVYDQAAVCFPQQALQAAHDHWSFHQDLFLFFELGGDNNLYVERRAGGRRSSIRARSWSLTAIGAEWEVMRQLVGYAAACEGGGMRLSNETRN